MEMVLEEVVEEMLAQDSVNLNQTTFNIAYQVGNSQISAMLNFAVLPGFISVVDKKNP